MHQTRLWFLTLLTGVLMPGSGIGHLLRSVAFAADQDPQIVEVQKIWSQPTHQSFFTDLIRFRDQWVCSFREATTHGSDDGYIQLICSPDGQHWVAASLRAHA